jgi:hypothetical protein
MVLQWPALCTVCRQSGHRSSGTSLMVRRGRRSVGGSVKSRVSALNFEMDLGLPCKGILVSLGARLVQSFGTAEALISGICLPHKIENQPVEVAAGNHAKRRSDINLIVVRVVCLLSVRTLRERFRQAPQRWNRNFDSNLAGMVCLLQNDVVDFSHAVLH